MCSRNRQMESQQLNEVAHLTQVSFSSITMVVHLWLRSEVKAFEHRTPLTPEACRQLIASGKRHGIVPIVDFEVEDHSTTPEPKLLCKSVGFCCRQSTGSHIHRVFIVIERGSGWIRPDMALDFSALVCASAAVPLALWPLLSLTLNSSEHGFCQPLTLAEIGKGLWLSF